MNAATAKRQVPGYHDFLETKRLVVQSTGPTVPPESVNPVLFPFQRDLVRWSLRKGRAALFADTGLGKTIMQLEWSRLVADRALIVAPLSVAQQTIREASNLLDLEVAYSEDGTSRGPITITNYERVKRFDPRDYDAVVLDESSILKGLDGKTRRLLTDSFEQTPYRLCCTATPAPNDITEIANHAEFLGVMSRADMLAAFFVHRHGGPGEVGNWHLKGHAREPFYRWLASWGMSIKKPSDLGYDDDGYKLPPLEMEPLFVKTEWRRPGELFPTELKGITDRAAVRRATIEDRCRAAVELVGGRDQWIVWCGLNEESAILSSSIEGAVEVKGSDSIGSKVERIGRFLSGESRVLVTKPSIAGFGMNFQHCHRMAFVGLSDSWEAYYQCVRRCWRFGQKEPVDAHVILSDAERPIFDNVMRKQRQSDEMSAELVENIREFEKEEIEVQSHDFDYQTQATVDKGGRYNLILGDCVEQMAEVESDSVGLSVYSPPFISLYSYTNTERDMGNSQNAAAFFEHYDFLIGEILRATMPGRHTCVHVQQVPTTKVHDGVIGLRDFRGEVVEHYRSAGWIYHGEIVIDKCPQAQAIRTKARGLMFVTKRKDSAWLRPAMADYILVFRKPGDNPEPIDCDVTNDEWISWARPIWYGIKETDVLKPGSGRDQKDEKHICPLQLETIERCVRLWSNKGDLVLSPFMGIGSEGVVSVRHGRRFVGIELKPSYFRAAAKNVENAARNVESQMEFDFA